MKENSTPIRPCQVPTKKFSPNVGSIAPKHYQEPLQCEYACDFHKGKVEWHHPISRDRMVGIYLCEAHHSIIQGRRFKYLGECTSNKSLFLMKREIEDL